jgi:hypothetical protein
VWGIKITALKESADFTTLDTEKLFRSLNLINCIGNVVLITMLLSLLKL